MKKVHFSNIIILIFLLTISISCKRQDSPETVTRKFANHLLLGEYEQAKQYGTSSTIQMIEMMESLASVGIYEPEEEEVQTISDADVECQVNETNAVCTYTEYGEPIEVNLIKVDQKWFVDFPLDEFLEDEEWYEEDEDNWEFNGEEVIVN